MTSVEYDLDTSGGLMEQILKLVAPPTSEDSSRKPKRAAREQRRSGRTVNHDCCDSCKEGGDLLCCDRCPAAFHLQCHDPPLTEDDVPSGEWVCRLCNLLAAEAEAKRSSKDGVTTTAAGGGLTAGVTALAATAEEMMEVGEEDGEEEDMNVDLEDCHPLMVLAKAARYTNPSQFELPKDIVCTQPLPGTSKRKWLKDSRSNPVKKLPHELDNGLVPLPAKLCFMCNKSCRRAPLIQCDFCSLLFHMDCLDPPLTTLPTGRWMCPNHPENFMDEKLLKSVSLSERIKLRAKFSGHINMHAIKIDFLKKIHRQSPPFRLKIRHPKRKSISIPSAIKDLYQNPPPLLPRASDSALVASMQPVPHTTHTAAAAAATNGAACTNGLLLPSDSALQPGGSNCVAAQKATSEEQEEWLASVVSLQTSIAKFLAQKQLTKSGDTTTTTTTTAANTTTSTTTTTSSPTATTIIRNIEETPSPATTTTSITTINCISEMMTAAVAATTNTIVSKAAPPVSSSLSVSHSKSVVANTLSSSPAIVNLNTTLQHCIEGQGEVELGKLDQKLVQILAWQRLQQLLPQQQAVPSVIEKKRTGYDEIQARALLCPLTGKGEPISMPYRTLSIGTGADMDVCLTHFGHCNYVSAKHAYIFYDETTRHYELLNYSEHGTTADNVLYSCDFSEKTATIRQPTPFVASVRSIIAKRKLSSSCKDGGAQNGIGSAKDNHDSCGEENHLNNIRPTMSAKWRGIKKQCNCTGSGSSLIGGSGAGWEGTALLHHGSYIKTGCLQFVFSIVDHAAIDASNFVKTEPLTAVTTTPTTPATVELRS